MLQLPHLFAKFTDKAAVLKATRRVVERYEDMAEAHYAIGVSALIAGENDVALNEVDVALERRPGWQQAAVLKAQVLRKGSPEYEALQARLFPNG